MRLALGAPRRRIVRQLLTESVLVALAAGAVGLFVIWILLRMFESTIPDMQIIIDWRGVAFTGGLAIVAGVVFGISPALHATRLALVEVFKNADGSVPRAIASAVGAGRRADRADAASTHGDGRDLILDMRESLRDMP